jgi:hypothetical protein
MRLFTAVAVVAMFVTVESWSKVAQTTLRELTASADLIVIGSVTKVIDVKGLKVAQVHVVTTVKGIPHATVYYLAQPTWICDTTGATVGEETLFFFNEYPFDPHPASMPYVKPAGGAGKYTVEEGASPVGLAFKEPTGFRERVKILVDGSSFWQVSWSGRGQMPIRNVHGTKYVTLWVGDVRLPTGMSTISGPEHECSFIRSVPLSAMLDFVQQQASQAPAEI